MTLIDCQINIYIRQDRTVDISFDCQLHTDL